ncbi:hypothetical protein LTS18_009042, partial [Coniosporium uncinatum]
MSSGTEVEARSRLRQSLDGQYEGETLHRYASRSSAIEEATTLAPPFGLPAFNTARRRSNASQSQVSFAHVPPEDLASLTRSASAISGHNEASRIARQESRESRDDVQVLPSIARPRPVKPGPVSTIREVPSELNTPYSTRPPSPITPYTSRPPSPTSGLRTPAELDYDERGLAEEYPDIGRIGSWRGALILLVTCGAQLLDNVFMTGVNISLPAIQREFG